MTYWGRVTVAVLFFFAGVAFLGVGSVSFWCFAGAAVAVFWPRGKYD